MPAKRYYYSDSISDFLARSAHTKAGYFAGQGKPVYVLIPEKQEPDLMYRLFAGVCTNTEELLEKLKF